MLGVDAVAIEFARSAGRDDEVGTSDDGKPERVFGRAVRGMESEHADDAVRRAVTEQDLRTPTSD